jgi:hypothetical protein
MQMSGDYRTLWQRFRMCDNLAYDPKPGDTEVRTNRLYCTVYFEALNNLCEMLNSSLIVLQPVFPLCDYKVWIDTERGEEAKKSPPSYGGT